MDNNNTLSDNISLSKDFINVYTLQDYHYLTTAKQVLILGAGFGGLASANLLRKSLPREGCQITVIDKNQYFMMGIVNLWMTRLRPLIPLKIALLLEQSMVN